MRARMYRILGILFCAVPPAVATLSCFPLWFSVRESTFSVLSLLLLALCLLPLRRAIKAYLRSPSAWVVWCILWGCLTFFDAIASGLRTVAAVGTVSGAVGELWFCLARRAAGRRKGGDETP